MSLHLKSWTSFYACLPPAPFSVGATAFLLSGSISCRASDSSEKMQPSFGKVKVAGPKRLMAVSMMPCPCRLHRGYRMKMGTSLRLFLQPFGKVAWILAQPSQPIAEIVCPPLGCFVTGSFGVGFRLIGTLGTAETRQMGKGGINQDELKQSRTLRSLPYKLYARCQEPLALLVSIVPFPRRWINPCCCLTPDFDLFFFLSFDCIPLLRSVSRSKQPSTCVTSLQLPSSPPPMW